MKGPLNSTYIRTLILKPWGKTLCYASQCFQRTWTKLLHIGQCSMYVKQKQQQLQHVFSIDCLKVIILLLQSFVFQWLHLYHSVWFLICSFGALGRLCFEIVDFSWISVFFSCVSLGSFCLFICPFVHPCTQYVHSSVFPKWSPQTV